MTNDITPRGSYEVSNHQHTSIQFRNKAEEFVFRYIQANPNQKEVRYLPDRPEISEDQKDILADFGLVMGTRDFLDLDKRKYLIVIEPEWWEDLDDHCQNYVEENLPEGAILTHFVLNKEITRIEEFTMWYNELNELYPGIQPLADYTSLVEFRNIVETSNSLEKQITDDLGMDPFYIDELLDKLVEGYKQSNKDTIKHLLEIEETILKAYRENPKIVLFNRGKNREYARIIAAYMFYKYKIPSHLRKHDTQMYLDGLSRLMYSPKNMLMEDKIEYILNLPRIAVAFDEFINFTFFVYLEKSKLDCRLRISYMDVEDENPEIYKTEVRIQDLSLIPWKYEFDVETTDLDVFRETHKKIMALFIKFEERQESGIELLDMTNTCLVEIDGAKKLAYVEGMELNLPAVFTPLNEGLEQFSKTITFENLKKIYPIDVLPGYQKVLAPYIKALRKRLTEIGVTDLRNLGSFYKHRYAFGYLIHEFNNYGYRLLSVSGFKDYMTLGLWWKETSRYRISIATYLNKYMYAKKARKFNDFFSIFGGPFVAFGVPLEVREEILKEW